MAWYWWMLIIFILFILACRFGVLEGFLDAIDTDPF